LTILKEKETGSYQKNVNLLSSVSIRRKKKSFVTGNDDFFYKNEQLPIFT